MQLLAGRPSSLPLWNTAAQLYRAPFQGTGTPTAQRMSSPAVSSSKRGQGPLRPGEQSPVPEQIPAGVAPSGPARGSTPPPQPASAAWRTHLPHRRAFSSTLATRDLGGGGGPHGQSSSFTAIILSKKWVLSNPQRLQPNAGDFSILYDLRALRRGNRRCGGPGWAWQALVWVWAAPASAWAAPG